MNAKGRDVKISEIKKNETKGKKYVKTKKDKTEGKNKWNEKE